MNSILSCCSALFVTLKNFVTYFAYMTVLTLHIHTFLAILFSLKLKQKFSIGLLYEFFFLI